LQSSFTGLLRLSQVFNALSQVKYGPACFIILKDCCLNTASETQRQANKSQMTSAGHL
jgi:hypothetical protein